MASKSTPALLKAIEGYTMEHGSSKQHEPIVSQLARITADVHKGSSASPLSPGRQAAAKAGANGMSSEAGHSGGAGNDRTNAPGHAGAPDQVPNASQSDYDADDRMSGAAPVKSAGNRTSVLPSSGLPEGKVEIRRVAAERESKRPDTRMPDEASHAGGKDNKHSNAPGEGYPPSGRVGDVTAPSLSSSGASAVAQAVAKNAMKPMEPTPPRVAQQPDAFASASELARKKLTASVK
jgi:hypothetical protein